MKIPGYLNRVELYMLLPGHLDNPRLTHLTIAHFFLHLALMELNKASAILIENHVITSVNLTREVKVDFYLPVSNINASELHLLLINDGQDLVTMGFENILEHLYEAQSIMPMLCVGIHCGPDRRSEYATSKYLDSKGRGAKAKDYSKFFFEELLPFIRSTFNVFSFREKSICGFSMGGLSALDLAWNNPLEFSKVGVFSGSMWWRLVGQSDPEFDEDIHRIMHKQVREGDYFPWLKFFFEVGVLDETADRNKNGIIDAIDDTVSLIEELVAKGYDRHKDIHYLELKDGRHDVATWARALPVFLKWGWARNRS